MAPPKLTLSISRQGRSPPPKSKKIDQTTIRYGESARPYTSPYSDSQAYVAPSSVRPQNSSSPQPYASPYKSPYASPSPCCSEPQAQEQFLPIQSNLQNAPSTPVERESLNGMDPPLPAPSSKGAKRTIPASTIAAAKRFKGESYYNSADRLFENEASPLYKDETSVKLILQHPMAQNSLATSQDGPQLPNTHSDDFAGAAASFKEDGRGGRHDHDWVAQAQAASHARRVGAFDEYDIEHFKKYWAAESRELSEDEGGKESDNGCGDDKDKNFRQRDEFDDDGDGGSFGGKASGFGPTGSATPSTGNGYRNSNNYGNSSNNVNDSKYGSTSAYGNGLNYGGYPSMYDNNSNYGNGSKNSHTSAYNPSCLPTPPATPASTRSGSIHSSIKGSTDMNDYPVPKHPYDLLDWAGRGYCDNPNSIYPELADPLSFTTDIK